MGKKKSAEEQVSAIATYSDEELCKAWLAESKREPKGTRMDVVVRLLKQKKVEDNDENRTIYYTKLGARYTQLKKMGLEFPELSAATRGRGVNREAKIASLKSIFGNE